MEGVLYNIVFIVYMSKTGLRCASFKCAPSASPQLAQLTLHHMVKLVRIEKEPKIGRKSSKWKSESQATVFSTWRWWFQNGRTIFVAMWPFPAPNSSSAWEPAWRTRKSSSDRALTKWGANLAWGSTQDTSQIPIRSEKILHSRYEQWAK